MQAYLPRAASGPAAPDAAAAKQAAAARQQALAQFEGMALSQIDAADLADLPWDLQRELIQTLPRSRADAAAAAAAPQAQARQRSGAEDSAGSDSGGSDGEEEGGGASDAGGSDEAGPARAGTPIVALPAFSQVDMKVMDALPLHVRRELERAYGEPWASSRALPAAAGHSLVAVLEGLSFRFIDGWNRCLAGTLQGWRALAGRQRRRPSAGGAAAGRRPRPAPPASASAWMLTSPTLRPWGPHAAEPGSE